MRALDRVAADLDHLRRVGPVGAAMKDSLRAAADVLRQRSEPAEAIAGLEAEIARLRAEITTLRWRPGGPACPTR